MDERIQTLRAENLLLRSECARLRTENEALKEENTRLADENKDLKRRLEEAEPPLSTPGYTIVRPPVSSPRSLPPMRTTGNSAATPGRQARRTRGPGARWWWDLQGDDLLLNRRW